jgi:hypothetical protein
LLVKISRLSIALRSTFCLVESALAQGKPAAGNAASRNHFKETKS